MEHNLNDLLITIGRSVQEAQQVLDRNTVNMYLEYFEQKNEVFSPITQTFVVQDNENLLTVPMVTMIEHSNMVLSQVDISFQVATSFDAKTGQVMVAPTRASAESSTTDTIAIQNNQINMKFRREQPAEGISRINQHFYKKL